MYREILESIVLMVLFIIQGNSRANKINRETDPEEDELLGCYRGLYMNGRYKIAIPVKSLCGPGNCKWRLLKWKTLNRFYQYDRPFKKLRFRAYIAEIWVQIGVLFNVVLLLAGIVTVHITPEFKELFIICIGLYAMVLAVMELVVDIVAIIYKYYLKLKRYIAEDEAKNDE